MTAEGKRAPVWLLVVGPLLVTVVGLLLLLPLFKCPVCWGAAQSTAFRMSDNTAAEEFLKYALTEMPCSYCDQRRRVRFPTWIQIKYRR